MDILEQARVMLDQQTGWPIIDRQPVFKIPFFGDVIREVRNVNGDHQEYFNLVRHFGWSEVFGITRSGEVITLIQWKPGVNRGSWELPPGGIGRITEDAPIKHILELTQQVFLKETGLGGGVWTNLGHIVIETGKYRGATPDSHGLKAHLWMADDLEVVGETSHANNELITILPVRLEEFPRLLESDLFVEESAVCCALKALRRLGL